MRTSARFRSERGTPFESLSEQEWAERIRNGSYEEFARLFRAFYEDLVRFCEGFVGKRDVAEGLVQDIFVNIWRGRLDWNPRGTLKAYLFGAARNHSLKYLRHRRIVHRLREDIRQWNVQEAESPDARVNYEEFKRAVDRAIDELPERRRQVFKLSREQGLTYAEISAVMNISVNTVENQMVRAMKSLRGRLSPFLGVGAGLLPAALQIFS